MKKTTIMLCLLLLGLKAGAQQFSQPLDGIRWVKIESNAKVIVQSHAQNNLVLKGAPMEPVPDQAKGLKLIGEGGTDNTNAGYYMVKEGSQLLLRNLKKTGESVVLLPASMNIAVTSKALNNIEITGFNGEIEANAEVTGGITITGVSGPVTAHSNTGQVKVVFNKVNQASPISIATATGAVDVTMPADTPANLSLQSAVGEIYTNFDIRLPEKEGLKPVSSQKVSGPINNGGVEIQLHSATGNIYLRKK